MNSTLHSTSVNSTAIDSQDNYDEWEHKDLSQKEI
jgi:hypothetical protein